MYNKIHTFGEYFKICSLWSNNSSFLNTRSRGCDLGGVTSCSFNLDLEWTLTNFFASKFDDNLEKSKEKCESRGQHLDQEKCESRGQHLDQEKCESRGQYLDQEKCESSLDHDKSDEFHLRHKMSFYLYSAASLNRHLLCSR